MESKCATAEATAVNPGMSDQLQGGLPFQSESPADHKARVAARRPELVELIAKYQERADRNLEELSVHLNAPAHLRSAERILQGVRAARDDDTPKLMTVPNVDGVDWPELIEEIIRDGQWLVVQPDAAAVTPVDEEVIPLADAKGICVGVRRRTRVCIDGNGSEPVAAEKWREMVLGGRSMPNSRPAWRNELHLMSNGIRAAIDAHGDEVPRGLVDMLPRIEYALRILDKSVDGRERPSEVRMWSRPVQVHMLALDLVIGDFLSWAAAHATDHRFTVLQNLITPRRTSDGTPVLASDPEAPAGDGEVLVDEDGNIVDSGTGGDGEQRDEGTGPAEPEGRDETGAGDEVDEAAS